MSATHLVVKNFERFQHYRDRNPPWIKLYGDVLVDLAFLKLPEAAQAQLMKLWILASQLGHPLPNDPKFLAGKIGTKGRFYLSEIIAAGFIIPTDFASNGDSSALADPLAKSSENATRPVRARFQSSELEATTADFTNAEFSEITPTALAVWSNVAIAERWGEQPSPFTAAGAVQLADALMAQAANAQVVRLSIYRQCRESKRTHPPRAVNYFRPGIEDDLASAAARRTQVASGETPPPKVTTNGKHNQRAHSATAATPGDRSYAEADAAFAALEEEDR
jgi:hypothetical protein